MSTPHAFVALYAGETVGSARIVGATADPLIVSMVADVLLKTLPQNMTASVEEALDNGQRIVLRIIQGGSQE